MQKSYRIITLLLLPVYSGIFFIFPYIIALSWEKNSDIGKFFKYFTFYWEFTIVGMIYRPYFLVVAIAFLAFVVHGLYGAYFRENSSFSILKFSLLHLSMLSLVTVPLILYRLQIIPYVGP